ncbi:MAG TPA: aldehyde dehydrogenase family protein [Nannocystis exedens]|nr:aldehyde dehydrogenase family protein [Nannocystis exedens]
MTRIREIFETMEYGPAPESAAPVVTWLDAHGRSFGHYIDGIWREPNGGEHFPSINPANAQEIAQIAQADSTDVDAAVAAARRALPAWRELPGHSRARYLYAIARQIQKHARFFSVLETLDNGKPIRESRDIDIPLIARHFYHHAGWAQLMKEQLPGMVPVGVVGQVIPWNFPLLMLSWKIAPALAMGNTVVLKPAELTSLTALAFAELCDEIGLPPGVVNIITGDGRTGAALTTHQDVDKVAFTGSTQVGRIIRKATAGSGKKLSLELGGKSPFIVFDDADLDSVVEGVVDAIWFNQGQVCCAGSRILVHEGIAGRLESKLKARMETLRQGDPMDKAIDVGAIIDDTQLETIRALVKRGAEEGATVWQPSWACPSEGFFYPPTLLTNVTPASMVCQVEIFGPVVTFDTFRTPKEAVALANNTRYGLAASVWTENLNLALDVAPKIKAGTVWVNCTNMFDASSGFGGYRESGYGREGGLEGLWEYCKPAWLAEAESATKHVSKDSSGLPTDKAEEHKDKKTPRPSSVGTPPIDRTPKMYIGGKQARPDATYALAIRSPEGDLVGEVGLGNRKDIRNAVEAAHAGTWAKKTAHNRAQVLYYIAENLSPRAAEFAARIQSLTGVSLGEATREVEATLELLFYYAAFADKWDGRVHHTPLRNVTLAMPEPLGVMGIVCPEGPPLLSFVALVAPALAMGNHIVAVPSERWPLLATDLYQVFDTSDLPAGAINIVTGKRDPLAQVLAAHDDVDGIWYFGPAEGSAAVERLSIGNMKRTWVSNGLGRDWYAATQGRGEEFLRQSTHIKNIWVPYGE